MDNRESQTDFDFKFVLDKASKKSTDIDFEEDDTFDNTIKAFDGVVNNPEKGDI